MDLQGVSEDLEALLREARAAVERQLSEGVSPDRPVLVRMTSVLEEIHQQRRTGSTPPTIARAVSAPVTTAQKLPVLVVMQRLPEPEHGSSEEEYF